jgi:hypothetical protein
MKNVFVELTEVEVDGAGKVTTQSCWVNMSRVQEMRLDSLQIPGVGPGKDVAVTVLTMNIPDYNIVVQEHPEMILRQLFKVNGEEVK